MSYGLEPTQMEEWRRKHRVRYFMESLLLDAKDVLVGIFGLIVMLNTFYKRVRSVRIEKSILLYGVLFALLSMVMLI